MALMGWCPGTLSVSDTLTHYPGTKAIRLFRNPTQGLPSWTGTLLSQVPADATILLSWKLWTADVNTWLTQMPAERRGLVYLTYHHEPEQQTGGDPTPTVFKQRWEELVDLLAANAKRSWIYLGPIYTHYWQQNTGPFTTFWPEAAADGIDFIGWDVYNESSTTYRTMASMFDLMQTTSDTYDKPYVVGEWGADRVTSDTTGTACADWMQSFADTAHADSRCRAATWFHYGGDDLIATGRTVEETKLAAIIAAPAPEPPPPPPPPPESPPPESPPPVPSPDVDALPEDMRRWLLTALDHTILITDKDLNVLGDPIVDWTNLDVTLRFNEPSSGQFTAPGYPWIRDMLAAGSRVVVLRNRQVLIAGPYEQSLYERSDDGENAGDGVLQVQFADDLARVVARQTYANPALTAQAQTTDQWTYTGNLEEALRAAVDLNAGPSALAARRVPHLVLGELTGIGEEGETVTLKSERFEPLGDLLRRGVLLGRPSGRPVGFRTTQVDDTIQFQVYEPIDKSAEVRFSFGLGNLRYIGYERSAPSVNAALVGGQGEGADRRVLEFGDTTSQNDWGRIEKLVARPGNVADAELEEDGLKELSDGAESVRLQITAMDTPDQRYGEHYDIRDIVAIEPWSGTQITDKVVTVHIQVYPTAGEVVTCYCGSQEASMDPEDIALLRAIDLRVGRLERRTTPVTMTS